MIPYPQIKKNKYNAGLYVVSTPIGNMNDITLRAIDVLSQSKYILCEDTRVSKKLLEKFKIKSILISNHKFNERKNINKIIEILKLGNIVSLISDAGTPGISDPGNILINSCVAENISIYPVPGSSALTAAASISGFSEKIFFYGFFPQKEKDLKRDLDLLSKVDCAIVFFISPNKINKNIEVIKKYFSGKKILICREISKFYEEYIRIAVDELKPFIKKPKGELTIVISPHIKEKNKSKILSESVKSKINKMIKKKSIKDIVQKISGEEEISKKIIYKYCLTLKNEN